MTAETATAPCPSSAPSPGLSSGTSPGPSRQRPGVLRALRRRLARLDRVVVAFALITLAVAAVAPAQAWGGLGFTLDSLISVAPYLLLSVVLAAYAQATDADALIARAFQGRAGTMVVIAALAGGLSPFCSCGVIPLIAALMAMGVPLPAVMAFWLASPLMDPSMFALTVGTIGLPFALFKTASAVGIGLLGGFGSMALSRIPAFAAPLRPDVALCGCSGKQVRTAKPVVWRFWTERDRRTAFGRSSLATTLFLGKWLALAFFLESLMLAWVPAERIAALVGSDGAWSVLIATAVGIPAYLNGYAALPVVGGLMSQGMAPGAAMAFLLAGGVTCIPAAVGIYALARPPVFLAYLGFALLGALTFGLLFGLVA